MAAAPILFSNNNPSFTVTLRRKVDEYFKTNNLSFNGNWKLYTKTIVLFTLAASCYAFLVFLDIPLLLSLSLCIVLGFTLAAIGFNVMHDGAHGSYSKKHWINEMMAYSLNLMGGSSYLWKQKHNITHHTYTNIEGHDDDIDIKPWIRTNEHQPRYWFHRFQHFYWAILYGSTYVLWVYGNDFSKYFRGKIGDTPYKKMKTSDHIIFWVSKVVYIGIFLVIPIIKLGVIKTIIGYGLTSFVCGWVISVIFQLAHLIEESEFPLPNEVSNKIDDDWAVHQIATTANFSTKSKIVSWFTGGLNFQIEHHLFPRISHVHYPAVSKLVKEVCREHNIQYVEYPTLFGALRSHVLYLKSVGRK